jgi:hypothetical protein
LPLEPGGSATPSELAPPREPALPAFPFSRHPGQTASSKSSATKSSSTPRHARAGAAAPSRASARAPAPAPATQRSRLRRRSRSVCVNATTGHDVEPWRWRCPWSVQDAPAPVRARARQGSRLGSGKTVLVQDLLLHQRHGRDPAVCVVVGNQNAEYDHLSLSDLVIKAYYGYFGLQHACTALHGWPSACAPIAHACWTTAFTTPTRSGCGTSCDHKYKGTAWSRGGDGGKRKLKSRC